jgi:hypothetical protein
VIEVGRAAAREALEDPPDWLIGGAPAVPPSDQPVRSSEVEDPIQAQVAK